MNMRTGRRGSILAVALLALAPWWASSATCWAGEKKEGHEGHKAPHGGSLNAIGSCENGHVEVKVTDDKLEAWFVGGGQDTNRSVRLKVSEITLSVKLPDGRTEKLVLKADPLGLALEKVGDCSHFTAKADWLKRTKEFEATGEVEFKGKPAKLIIQYPGGYDPD